MSQERIINGNDDPSPGSPILSEHCLCGDCELCDGETEDWYECECECHKDIDQIKEEDTVKA